MAIPNFEIKTLNGMKLPIEECEPDMTVQELTNMVVSHLEYDVIDDGHKQIEYFLENGRGERLTSGDKMSQVGVMKDEVLTLKSSTHVESPVEKRLAQPEPAPPGKVNVYVQLLDLSRNELETFDLNQKAGDILNEIIRKYRLPTRDEKLKEGKFYTLFSKTSAAVLHEGMTLRDAKIPELDTFIVSTKEIPG